MHFIPMTNNTTKIQTLSILDFSTAGEQNTANLSMNQCSCNNRAQSYLVPRSMSNHDYLPFFAFIFLM